MTDTQMVETIKKLTEWENLMNEAKEMADSLRDEIKAELTARETEEVDLGDYIVRWTSILSNRFDATEFKKTYGELYKQFTKQSASRRFTISY